MSDMERERDEARRALAASQQDLTRALAERDELREQLAVAKECCASTLAAAGRNVERLTFARYRLGVVEKERDAARDELTQLRTAVAGVLAELRELAAFNRADARRFAGTSSPNGFGPHRAAEAYEKAVALVEHIHNPTTETEATNG